MLLVLIGEIIVLIVSAPSHNLSHPFLFGISTRIEDFRSARARHRRGLCIRSILVDPLSFATSTYHEIVSSVTSARAECVPGQSVPTGF